MLQTETAASYSGREVEGSLPSIATAARMIFCLLLYLVHRIIKNVLLFSITLTLLGDVVVYNTTFLVIFCGF